MEGCVVQSYLSDAIRLESNKEEAYDVCSFC